MQQQYIPQQNLKCRHPNCFQSFPDPNQLYSHELQCKQQQFQSAPNTGAQHYTPSGPQNQWQSTGPTASGFGYQAPNTLNQPQPSTYLSNQFRSSTDWQHKKPDTQAMTSTQSQGYHPSYQTQPYVDPSHLNYNTPPLPHVTPDPRQGQNTQFQAQSSAYNQNQYPIIMERQPSQPDTLAPPMSQWQGQQPYNQWPQTQLQGVPPLYPQHQTPQPSVNLQPSQVGYKTPILRSLLGSEFGIQNDCNKKWNNCFLNVCLQALWQCTAVRPCLLGQDRTGLTLFNTFCDLSLKPFVTSLMDFYQQAAQLQDYKQNVKVLNSNKVRAELFKFFYKQNKFVLHNGADAQEALDNILTILHATFAHNATISNFDKQDVTCDTCPIHRLFYQQVYKVQSCCCGEEKKGVENVNQFFQMVFIDQLLEDQDLGQLSALQGCLMNSIQKKMAEVEYGCVNPGNDGNGKEHQTTNKYFLSFIPEVYLFNLQWFDDPDRETILKVFVSLPATFSLRDLFSGGDETVNYTIKGLICHTGGHYLSFYRRVAHLQGNQNESNLIFEASQIEWTLYNDEEVICIGPWFNMIKYCISSLCKPTVVIYEKYQQISHSQSHLLQKAQIEDLIYQCSDDYVPEPEQAFVNTNYQERPQNQVQNPSATQKIPSSTLVKLPEFNPNTFRQIKRKYENDGFYLFKCENCANGIFALHIKRCLWFSNFPCQNDNDFCQEQQSLSSQDVQQNKLVNAKFIECLAELKFAFLPFEPSKKNIKEPKAPYVLHQIQMEQPLESPTQAQPLVQPFFPRKESIEPVSPLRIPELPSQVSPLRSEDASQNLAPEPKPKDNYDLITSTESQPIAARCVYNDKSTLVTPAEEKPNLRPSDYDYLRPYNQPQSISLPDQPIQASFFNLDFHLSYFTPAESKPKGNYDYRTSAKSEPIQAPHICQNSEPFLTPLVEQPNKKPLQNDDFKPSDQPQSISLPNQPIQVSLFKLDLHLSNYAPVESKPKDTYDYTASTQSQPIVIHEHSQPLPKPSFEMSCKKPSTQQSEFYNHNPKSIELPQMPTPGDKINESSILQPENKPSQIPAAAAGQETVQTVQQRQDFTMTFGQQSQEHILVQSEQSQKIKRSSSIQQKDDPEQDNNAIELSDFDIKLSQDFESNQQEESISIHSCGLQNEFKGDQDDKATDLNDEDKCERQDSPLSNNAPAESKPEDNYDYRTSNQSQPILGLPICNQTQTQPTQPVVEQPNNRPLQNNDFRPANNSQSIQLPDQSRLIVIHKHSQPLPILSVEKPLQKPPTNDSKFYSQPNPIAQPKTSTSGDVINESSNLKPENKPSQIPAAAASYEQVQPWQYNQVDMVTFGQQSWMPTLVKSQESHNQLIQPKVNAAQHNDQIDFKDIEMQLSREHKLNQEKKSISTHPSGLQKNIKGDQDDEKTVLTENDQSENQSGQSEMIEVWQCTPCKNWMYLADSCPTCNQPLHQRALPKKTPNELTTKMTKLEFQQLQLVEVYKPKTQSKMAVEESKDEDLFVWKCPKCKVYMDLASKCTKCGQFQRDDWVVNVKREHLYQNEFGHQESMRDAVEQQQLTPQYWQCPKHFKIMRSDQVCPQCLYRIDQYTEIGHSLKDLMNFQIKVVDQEKDKIQPGQWHCDNCNRSLSVNCYCKECGFWQNGFTKIKGWKCPNCKSINDESKTKCGYNRCNIMKKQHFPDLEFSFWKCSKDKQLVEKGSACSKCFKSKEQYDNIKKEAQKQKQQQEAYKLKQLVEASHPSKCWVCYCCGNDKNPVNYNQCEIRSCPNKYGSDYYTDFWVCFKCNNKNEVDDWIKEEVAECQNHKCKDKSKTIQDFIEKHKKARLSECKNCKIKHYPQNAKDFCRPCLQFHFKCFCKYGCSQCEGYAYTKCEKCTQLKCRKGAKICRECTEKEEMFGLCQICFIYNLKNGQCPQRCQQQERRKQCFTCYRYFMGKPGELCFVCCPRNQVRNSTATYYKCEKCGVHRSEPGYCNNCKPGFIKRLFGLS